MRIFSRCRLLAALVSVAILPGPGRAQEEALKIVYSFPAGGAGDAIARILADHLHKSLGRNVVVENRTGAGGRIGAQAVKQAAANGSMLLFGASGQFTVQPHFSPDLGYDPFADFLPVSQVVRSGLALAVSPEVPARSIGELAAWLKANPDRAIFGSPGAGTSAHFAGVELGRLLGISLHHLPYKGTPAAFAGPDDRTGAALFRGERRTRRAAQGRHDPDTGNQRRAAVGGAARCAHLQGKRLRFGGANVVRAIRTGGHAPRGDLAL
jgi:tripartite-type tricarboxylate transporter receptor subunit TctC